MKTAHVYIYGIVDSEQNKNASEYGYINLNIVKDQIDTQKGFEEIMLHIHSVGGDVSEGFAIYDYLKSLGKPITSQIEGNCYSIATVIALAGSKRVMTPHAELLIHNPWGGGIEGEKQDFKKYAEQLEKIEQKIANFYASNTNLNQKQALDFMKVETTFTPQQALENGFITEIKDALKVVALYKPKKNKIKNKTEMPKEFLTKKEAKKSFKNITDSINGIFNILKGEAPKNLLIQDANGVEIDFFEIEADATPKKGDKATIDGESPSGEYVMPNGETYVFEDGVLIEIKTEEEEGGDEDTEALKLENEQLKAENKKMKKDLKKASKEIQNVVNEVQDLKKNISSTFNYNPQIDDKKGKKSSKKQTRNLFKDKN